MSLAYVILGLVTLQRMAEAIYGGHNARRLIAGGGQEAGARHYPVIVLLHASFLGCLFVSVPPDAAFHTIPLGVFLGLQALRIWVMTSLGRFWTTRIITLPGAPLVTRGPYKFLRHPNYWVVGGKFAALPLVFGAWEIAVAFSALNPDHAVLC